MLLLDAFVRFSGVGMLLLSMVLIIRDLNKSPGFWYVLLANICITSHFMGFTTSAFELPYYLRMLLRFIDVFLLYFLWLFALSLFQKDFRLKIFHIVVVIIYAFPMLMERCVQFNFIDSLPLWWAQLVNGLNLLLIMHMVVFVLKGRNDDLIEKRRKSRLYLVYMMAICATTVVFFAHILLKYGWTQYQPTINIIGIWPAIVWSCLWLFSIEKSTLSFDDKQPSDSDLSHRDIKLKSQLDDLVIEQKIYLEPNLSIDDLAKRLGVTAHRLRAFINQTLGFQNFSTYVNSYRIAAIKQALLNPENAHVPILTIAMNHGFNSLSPFNRSFKKIENMTPKAFRQQHCNNA